MSERLEPSQQAQQIISFIVDRYQSQAAQAPNQLRFMEQCVAEISEQLKIEGLFQYVPFRAVIGDVDPRTFGRTRNGEVDSMESQFANLADALLLDPRTERYQEMLLARAILEQSAFNDLSQGAPSQYDTTARGLPISRQIIAQEADQLGITADKDDVWMGDGGMGILVRSFRTLTNLLKQKKGEDYRPSVIISFPYFNMAGNAASDNGLRIIDIDASDLPKKQLTAQRLEEQLGDKKPDIFLITPADNPTSRSIDPENLRGLIESFLKINPEGYFIFDMAYISMIPRKTASAIMKVVEETGAIKKSIFAFSESKKYAIPGLRVGAAVILGEKLKTAFQSDTIRNYPGFSKTVDYEFIVRSQMVKPESLNEYIALLRQRQYYLLTTLKALDPNHELFEDLDDILIPGYENELSQATLVQDVPLYLYVKLKDGVSAWDLIKKLNIVGVPGKVFGDTQNYVRFSVGVVSTSDISSLSQNHP